MRKFQSVDPLPRLEKYVFQEKFARDTRPGKILASTGAYKNIKGEIPQFQSVQIATRRVREKKLSKAYLDIAGYPPFRAAVDQFLFGGIEDLLAEKRVITIHTPGGTAALRIGADFIQSQWPGTPIWVSDPTWGNHIKVFETAGLTVRKFPYYDASRKTFDLEALLANIEAIPDGNVIFFQGSTHNPTCIDPEPEDWVHIAKLVAKKGLLPFFDVAFFGFSNGIGEDLKGLRIICEKVDDLILAASFSKSFALYNDRIGVLSVLGSTGEAAQNVYSHLRHLIRANYSNPPLYGAAVVTEILIDPDLYQVWEREIAGIRLRIHTNRERLVEVFKSLGVSRDLSHILREKGLFTNLTLPLESIQELQDLQGIYISSTGRINVTAMTDEELDHFCDQVSRYLL